MRYQISHRKINYSVITYDIINKFFVLPTLVYQSDSAPLWTGFDYVDGEMNETPHSKWWSKELIIAWFNKSIRFVVQERTGAYRV